MTNATLVYDDDCGFCTQSALFLAERAPIAVVGFSELDDTDLQERLPDDYEDCSHLVTDEAVYSCGESIEQALLLTELGVEYRSVVEFLRKFEDYEALRERGYERVADDRSFWSQVISLVGGDDRRRS